MLPRSLRLFVAPVALVLALAACGGDDDDDAVDSTTGATTEATTEATTAETSAGSTAATTSGSSGETYSSDEYVAAIVEQIGGDEDTSACVGEALVNAVGTDRIEASGVTPEEFASTGALQDIGLEIDASAGPAMQADLESCPSLIDLFAGVADSTDEQKACVEENFTESQIAEVFVVQFTGGTLSQELLDAQAATQACASE